MKTLVLGYVKYVQNWLLEQENAPSEKKMNQNNNKDMTKVGDMSLPAGLNYRNIEKYQKRQRKYSNFNRMIMPKDWRQEGFERRATVWF